MSDSGGLMIGALAKLAGVTAEAIRYYEREGIIPPATRSGTGGYRRYDRADAHRLRFVRRARELGFSLDDVRELLTLAEGDPNRPCANVDDIARTHIAQIDDKLTRLTALRAELVRLTADCRADADIAECSLLTPLNA